MRQKAIKDAEKERANFYAKQKEGQKDVRAKYREKVRSLFAVFWARVNFLTKTKKKRQKGKKKKDKKRARRMSGPSTGRG